MSKKNCQCYRCCFISKHINKTKTKMGEGKNSVKWGCTSNMDHNPVNWPILTQRPWECLVWVKKKNDLPVAQKLSLNISFGFFLFKKILKRGAEPSLEHIPSSLRFSVNFTYQWWFGEPSHPLFTQCISVGPKSAQQSIFEHFMLPSAWKLYAEADFDFHLYSAPALTMTRVDHDLVQWS